MRRHTADGVITTALRALDPSPKRDLTESELEHANATFARILATPGDQPVAVEPDRARRRLSRRLLVPVCVAGAAGIATPLLLLGGGDAYASWTPKPEPLNDATAVAAAATCRAALQMPAGAAQVAVADRRGEWTYVLLAAPEAEAQCLMPDDRVGRNLPPGDDFFGSYVPDPVGPPVISPDNISEITSMQGNTSEGWFIWVQGYVGSDVRGVTVQTSSGLDIEASVEGNRFAAWWPSVRQDSAHPAETWSYTVRLANGSVRDKLMPSSGIAAP